MNKSLNLKLDRSLAKGYKSSSQIARIMTEQWVCRNLKTPCCNVRFHPLANNTRSADFTCSACNKPFQLKSSQRSFNTRVTGAEYRTTLNAFEQTAVRPSLILLRYNGDDEVTNLSFIHRKNLSPSMIHARKPLSKTAERSGWQGCSVFLKDLLPHYRLDFVVQGIVRNWPEIVQKWEED